MNMHKAHLIIPLLGSVSLMGQTPYVVDQDLGDITNSITTITGDTSSAAGPVQDNARYHENLTFSDGNWGNERVYEFNITEPSLLELQSTTITGDPDFILLDGLGTILSPLGKDAATNAISLAPLDNAAPETNSFGAFPPGAYYIAAEHFLGFDGGVAPGDSQYTVELIVTPATPRDFATYIGHRGAEGGGRVTFDTVGSAVDTVIAVYDSSGNVIATDDNSGGGTDSRLEFDNTLPFGTYFLHVGSAGTTFESGFSVTPGPTDGNINLNYDQGDNLQTEIDALDATFASTAVKVYEFNIAARPETFAGLSANLGIIANASDTISFDMAGSAFDTQLAIFDANGFFFDFNDDADPDNGIFTSYLEYPAGMPEGVYYAGVSGYVSTLGQGFIFDPEAGAEFGSYSLSYPGDTVVDSTASGVVHWYRFEIEAVPAPPGELMVSIANLDAPNNSMTLTWNNAPGSTYAVESSPDGITFTPVLGQSGLTDTATFPIDPTNNPRMLFQVVEEAP